MKIREEKIEGRYKKERKETVKREKQRPKRKEENKGSKPMKIG